MEKELTPAPEGDLFQETTRWGFYSSPSLASHTGVYSDCVGPNPVCQCLPETTVITTLFTLQKVVSSEFPVINADAASIAIRQSHLL